MKTFIVHLTVSDDEYDRLERHAQDFGIPLGNYLEIALPTAEATLYADGDFGEFRERVKLKNENQRSWAKSHQAV